MSEELLNRHVKCPTCGDLFTIQRGLAEAGGDLAAVDGIPGSDRRRTSRAPTVSIRILHEDSLREFPVKDITPKGLGILHLGWRFELGRVILFDLIEGYKFLLKGLAAKVVRIDDEAIGCVFENVAEEEITPIYHAALTKKVVSGKILLHDDDTME
ncbi:PilZ domain-containing protein [Megalodesulfovibrio gigas]|uniref:PilZ domain-containing protein n=1 Tax=Megalodesulfovibrio gigas (strain ATCC 19364 / DSM 1382 / NCIMB 9332 / VKM B-1759) TaxID=1121448 RepID=T2GFV0_MEGG1|nr:PilZ domain-containing protein [Megalodesulfovibrio gigas]AGW15188.1 hypothetical protein DGI_3511 [Megalodesulfovibrio gigas DSM 1382 = ATCC 19364]